MYYIYILKSTLINKTYVGYTFDINNRLREHNTGHTKFTDKYKPWKIIYTEICKTKSVVIKREKYFKSAAGRRWIKKNLFK